MSPERLVVVALGSNLGDSANILERAFDRLQTLAVGCVLRSSTWRSAPVDCPPDTPPFLNAVAAFEVQSGIGPHDLLRKLKEWEMALGRRPKRILNEARHVDLDLIGFGREQFAEPELTVPHPRAHQRAFVLAPLRELLPDLILPGWGGNVRDLLAGLKDAGANAGELVPNAEQT